MRIGMIGAGGIASKLAATIAQMKGVSNYAIASRSLEKAEAFKQANGFEKAYGSYEELVADPLVDLVYIATPHSEHYRNMELALRYHKPVLCEKAFTADLPQAADILSRFEQAKVFVAEAIWTRYLPSRKIIDDLLAKDVIGKPYLVSANLCYPNKNHPRLNDPSLAGGALLDMGIYPLTFALMIYHSNPSSLHAECRYSETGVDEATTMLLHFPEGQQAVLFTSMDGPSDRTGFVYGSKGYLEITNINNPEKIQVFNANHEGVATYSVPKQISGYEYEILECQACLKQGLLEPPSMPHQTTLEVMRMMDAMRQEMGIVYPFEK
jgi:predicted dehydrogenase